jgi:hypothetical protein
LRPAQVAVDVADQRAGAPKQSQFATAARCRASQSSRANPWKFVVCAFAALRESGDEVVGYSRLARRAHVGLEVETATGGTDEIEHFAPPSRHEMKG